MHMTELEKIYFKNYREQNREKINRRRRERRNENLEAEREKDRQYRLKNKEKINQTVTIYKNNKREKINSYYREYYKKNKTKINQTCKTYRNNNKDKIKLKNKRYKENFPENVKKSNKKYLKKLASSPEGRLKRNIYRTIRAFFKNEGILKNRKTIDIFGCTFEEFKLYIESKFEPWMNWNNYGNWNGYPTIKNQSWDLDHIIPLSKAKTEEDVYKLNHYTNFQPLCSYINRYIKRNNL